MWEAPTVGETTKRVKTLCGRTTAEDMVVVDPTGACGCDACRERFKAELGACEYWKRFSPPQEFLARICG